MIIIPIKRVVRIRISAEIVATTAPAWVTSKKKKDGENEILSFSSILCTIGVDGDFCRRRNFALNVVLVSFGLDEGIYT
jgi:hypothetical protein